MKNFQSDMIILVFCFVLFGHLSCEKTNDVCDCRELEDCINSECVLKENCYYFGSGEDYAIIGSKLFEGFLETKDCVDTVLFDIYGQNDRFGVFVNSYPYRFANPHVTINTQLSTNIFRLNSTPVNFLCREKSMTGMRAEIYSDSIELDVFYQPDSVGLPWDSAKVILYHLGK